MRLCRRRWVRSPPVAATECRPDVARSSDLQPALQELAQDLSAPPLEELFGLTVRQLRSSGREQLLDEVFGLQAGLVELIRILYGKCGSIHPLGPPGGWPTSSSH